MVKLSLEEQELATSIYRRYKSNPKTFVLNEEERVMATRLIDVTAFDIGSRLDIEYQGYSLSITLLKSDLNRDVQGEDSRLLKEVLESIIYDRSIKLLSILRRGEIPDNILAAAIYVQLGIAHNVIPILWDVYKREQVMSMALREVVQQEARDGIIRN